MRSKWLPGIFKDQVAQCPIHHKYNIFRIFSLAEKVYILDPTGLSMYTYIFSFFILRTPIVARTNHLLNIREPRS